MEAMMNDGFWKDRQDYPYRVVSDPIGSVNVALTGWDIYYISPDLRCTCGKDNCEHVAAVRRQLQPAAV